MNENSYDVDEEEQEIVHFEEHKPISMPSTSHQNIIRGLLDSNNKSCTYKRDLIVFILSLYLAATRATFCERYSDCSLISNWKKSNKQRSLTHKRNYIRKRIDNFVSKRVEHGSLVYIGKCAFRKRQNESNGKLYTSQL